MDFGCEVGVCTDCVAPRHRSHHGHDLAGQRYLGEAQTTSQGAHCLLMIRPSKKFRVKVSIRKLLVKGNEISKGVNVPPCLKVHKQAVLLTCTSAAEAQPDWWSRGTEPLAGLSPRSPDSAPSIPPENPQCCLRNAHRDYQDYFKLCKAFRECFHGEQLTMCASKLNLRWPIKTRPDLGVATLIMFLLNNVLFSF